MAFGSRLSWTRPGLEIGARAMAFGGGGEPWRTDGALDLRLGRSLTKTWHPVVELSTVWQSGIRGAAAAELGGRAWLERRRGKVALRAGLAATQPIGSQFGWALGGIAAAEVRLGAFVLSSRLSRSVARVMTQTGGREAAPDNPGPPPIDTLALSVDTMSRLVIGDTAETGPVSISPTVASLGVSWAKPSLRLEGRLIQRFAVDGKGGLGWGASVRVPTASGLALRVEAGFLPAGDAVFLPNRHYLTLGLELVNRRLAAPADAGADRSPAGRLAIARLQGTAAVLTLRRPGAASVEVMGDFTDWRPVAMAPALGDVWSLTIAIPAGVHQINLRVDGGPWTVPPGLPRADDEFGGEVGVLVAP